MVDISCYQVWQYITLTKRIYLIDCPGIVPTSLPRQDGCLQTDDNAARQLAALTQRRVDDWSCPGQTSVALVERTRTAIAKNYLGPATTNVVIGIGGNDSGPFAAQQGIDVNNPQAVHDALTTGGTY